MTTSQPTMVDLMNKVADQDQINVGDTISGTIINVAKNKVLVDIPNVGIGLVRGRELYNDEYVDSLNIGEEVESIVIDIDNEEGMMELSFRAIGREKVWAAIQNSYDSKETVQAKVKEVNRGGFVVQVNGVFGFLPASLLGPNHAVKQVGSLNSNNLSSQLEQFLGQMIDVKIIAMNMEDDSIIVSEKEVTDELAAVKLQKYKIGDVVEGEVVGAVDFGLFVRFDEQLEGLVHISEMAWKKIDRPQNEFKNGDKVTVKIIDINEDNRINLSIKQTQENPWVKFANSANIGDEFEATISKITNYGIIATNADEIQGLCHLSQVAQEEITNPSDLHDIIKIGEKKVFKVLSLDDKEKLSLTLLEMKEAQKRESSYKSTPVPQSEDRRPAPAPKPNEAQSQIAQQVEEAVAKAEADQKEQDNKDAAANAA